MIGTHGLTPALEPNYAIAPGETLRFRLEELGMSQAELARRTGLTPKHVNQVVKGAVSLSADVAQRLEYATGVPTHWWLRLEADYRAKQARLVQASPLDTDLAWVDLMPVRALVGLGVLPKQPADKTQRLRQLLGFFGVASVEAFRNLWRESATAFRQSDAYDIDQMAVIAWLRLGELAAQKEPSPPRHDPERLRAALPTLRALTRRGVTDALEDVAVTCRACGVTLVLVEEVPGARAFGATRWLGAGQRPVVQLSLRGKSDDKFWVTLFHELGHVLLHDRKSVFIEAEGAHEAHSEQAEIEANDFAWDLLIPEPQRRALASLSTVEEAVRFAEEISVAPSIVAARLHRDGLWDYSLGAHLKSRVTIERLVSEDEEMTDAQVAVRRRRASRHLPGELL